MKIFELLFLLFLVSKSLEEGKNKIIRKLQDDDSDSPFEDSDELESISDIEDTTSDDDIIFSTIVNINNDTSSDENQTSLNISTEDTTIMNISTEDTIIMSTNIVIPNSTLPNNSSISIIRPYIVLVGFGNYKRTPGKNFLTFNIFFKKFLYGILSQFLTFPVNINYSGRLRFLEEKRANCTKEKEEGENINYNCLISDIDPNKTILSLACKNDYQFSNGTNIENGNFELIQSSFANSTMKNIEKQTSNELENTIDLYNTKLVIKNPNTFIITGNLKQDIYDKKITFSLDENGDGKLKNITCLVNNLRNKNYEFTCMPEETIKANLNGAMGKTPSGKNILINFEKDSNGNFNDYINIEENNNSVIKKFEGRKSSNRRISAGIISGIAIACVVAFIIIIVIILACRGNTKPPVERSVIEIYSINNSNSNANPSYA